jgi:DNA-binding NarL/FixJ family response regulator
MSSLSSVATSTVARARPKVTPPIVALSERVLVRELIVDLLQHHGFPRARGGEGLTALYRAIPRAAGGLVLVDLGSEAEDPRELIREVRTHRPETSIVAVGSLPQLAALAADADGWIEMTEPAQRMSRVAAAVSRPHRGRVHFEPSAGLRRELGTWKRLTPRQRQVLTLLGCGVSNQRLASTLGLSERAVKAHVSDLLERFEVDNRSELALIACHAGLRSPKAGSPLAT